MATKKERWLLRHDKDATSKSKSLALALNDWFLRYARHASRKASKLLPKNISRVKKPKSIFGEVDFYKSEKSPFDTKLESDLYYLLLKYGLIQLNNGGKKASNLSGSEWLLKPEIRDAFSKEIAKKVVLLIKETEQGIRDSLNEIIRTAMLEEPKPSTTEISRRIARQWHGPVESRESLFSFERAERIARTELLQAENQGIKEGFTDAGIKFVRWSANPNDGRSGDREHWKMNNHDPISTEDMNKSDRSKWFKLPDGTRMPYPGWPGGPAKHLVNCRCTLMPARGPK